MKSLLRKLRIPVTARDWHSLIAMVFLLVLMFLFVTGTLSVFAREIDRFVTPEQSVVVGPEGKRAFGAVYDAVEAAYPDARQLAILRQPGAKFADQVTVATAGQGRSLVYVDPYRATVQGTGPVKNLWLTLRELHRGLSSERRKVQFAVTLMTLPLALLLVTSLMLHRKFYLGFFRLPRRGARLRAQLGDLHRLIGAWSVVFLTVLVVTSAEFMIEFTGFGPGPYPSYTEAAAPGAAALPAGFTGTDLDRAVALATETFADLRITDIALPAAAGQPLVMRGDLTSPVVRSVANAVYVDPATLTLRGAHRAETIGAPQWLFEAMRVIHYGSFGGVASRILWLIFGLALSVLAALGALIYAERLIFMSERSDKYTRRSRLGHIWSGMGVGKWIGLAGFAATLWWTIW